MINFLIRASNREQAMRRAPKRPLTLSITEFSDIADALERIGTQHDPERLMKCVQLALKANQQKRDRSHDNGLTSLTVAKINRDTSRSPTVRKDHEQRSGRLVSLRGSFGFSRGDHPNEHGACFGLR